jgi:hypothetical protein
MQGTKREFGKLSRSFKGSARPSNRIAAALT